MSETIYPLKDQGGQTLYAGEIELNIPAPVNMKTALILYNSLDAIPELKLLFSKGTFSQGAVIMVELEKPIPLIETLLSKIPNVEIIPEKSEMEGIETMNLNSGNMKENKEKTRIKLVLKGT
ncbi:hypothetical protein ACFLYV_03545 [Chloroflexota bacterium]